jgi:hypothetical protein
MPHPLIVLKGGPKFINAPSQLLVGVEVLGSKVTCLEATSPKVQVDFVAIIVDRAWMSKLQLLPHTTQNTLCNTLPVSG